MMTQGDMLRRIMGYFGQAKNYSEALVVRLTQACEAIDEEERERVLEKLEDEHEATRILSIKNLAETCRGLGVNWRTKRQIAYAESSEVVCGACELPYRFKPSASEWERIEENVHATCPRCGWPHSDQLRYEAYCRLGMQSDAKYHITYAQQTKYCRDSHLGPGKDPAWSRATAVAERDEAKKEAIERIFGDAMHSVKKTTPAQVPISQLKSVRPKPETVATAPFDDDLVY